MIDTKYNPFDRPPEDYKDAEGRVTYMGKVPILAKDTIKDHVIDAQTLDSVRESWSCYDYWLPLPPTPVKPKRFHVVGREGFGYCVYDTTDNGCHNTRANTIHSREAAEQIAAIYEAQP